MPFGLWNRKVEATVDRQRQVDTGYAVRRLEQGDLTFFAGDVGMDIALMLRNISLEPRAAHKAVEGGIRGRMQGGCTFTCRSRRPSRPRSWQRSTEARSRLRWRGCRSPASPVTSGSACVIESTGHTVNGMSIVAKNGSVKLHFEGADRVVIPLRVQDRQYSQSLTGKLMWLLVKAVIKLSLEGRAG